MKLQWQRWWWWWWSLSLSLFQSLDYTNVNTSVKVQSGFTIQLAAFKVSPEEMSLSTIHFAACFSQLQARLLTRGLLVPLLTLQSVWRPNYITKHHAINVEDFDVSSHMLKWFYMAPFLSLACSSPFSCTCPVWEGIFLAITACRSLFLLYLVKVSLPQRVWVIGERRESKCLCWVSGCGSASGCGAGQTARPASTPHLRSAHDDRFLMATWAQFRASNLSWSLLQPALPCCPQKPREIRATKGLCSPPELPQYSLTGWDLLESLQSTSRYQSKKGYTVFITEVCQP